ncbi:acyl-coenzyme A dehydrogenase, partial [Baffinella frigidus]
FSENEEMMRESVRRFATEVLAPKVVADMDRAEALDPAVLAACFDAGIMGIEAPEEYGGSGMGFTAACLAVEEIARVDPSVAVMVDIQNTLLITAFMRYGTPEQKTKYLTRMCTDTVASFCLSEAGSGSDAFALKTSAKLDEATGEWVLDGTKAWISNSAEAGLFVVFANADFTKSHRGITAFIIERSNPGLSVGKKEEKLGIRASSTCEVRLEGCRVTADAVLGQVVGDGYKMAIGLLNEGRIGIGAQMAIADFQGMQFQYARAAAEIEGARVMVYNAARLKESGQPFVQEAAMAKLLATEVAQKVSSQCIDWVGGVGFTKGLPFEKFYRDSKIGTIYEGTSNIQLATIAKGIQSKY